MSKAGLVVKANDRSGWDLDSEMERRPIEENPVAIKEVSGLDHLGPPLKLSKPKAQKGPTEEGRLEVFGPPHLGPLPNNPAKEMGRPQLVPFKGSAGIGHPISYPIVPVGVRAREACREEAYGWPDGVMVGALQGSSSPSFNFKELTDEVLKEKAARYTSFCPRDVFSFGERVLYSSSSLSGWDEMIVDSVGGSDFGE